jgi:hypothetical protein
MGLTADGGDGFQIWKVAANILNKQSWTTHKGWLGVGVGLRTHRKETSLLRNIIQGDNIKMDLREIGWSGMD